MHTRVLMTTVMRGRRAQCTTLGKTMDDAKPSGMTASSWAAQADPRSSPIEPAAGSFATATFGKSATASR